MSVRRDKVDVLIGTVHTGVEMGIVKVVRESGTLHINPNAGAGAATRALCAPNIFRTSFTNWQPAYQMGKVLAEYLIDHLPFETEHSDMLNTVRLVLQPGLITEEQRRRLWESGRSRATYRIGFLAIEPDIAA